MKRSLAAQFRPPLLAPNLWSLGIPLSVALFLSVVTYSRGEGWLELTGTWVTEILLGTLAFRISWFIWFQWRQWPYRQWTDHLPYLLTGTLLAFGFLLFYVIRPKELLALKPEVMVPALGVFFLQVAAISLLIHVIMHFSGVLPGFARHLEESQQQRVSLELPLDEGNRWVPKQNLLAVTVADHYCTLFFEQNGQVEEHLVYGALKDFEQATEGYLERIGRSGLVNPQRVWRYEDGERMELFLEGLEQPFGVSRGYRAHWKAKFET